MNNNISVIIVTYNSQKTIVDCLESIIKYSPESEIIIVDNESQDQTLKLVQGYKNKVKLIKTGGNLGFAKACNLGGKSATNKYLVFLNPDTKLLKANSLEDLKNILISNSQYGIIAPKLIYPDKTEQIRVRHLPTVFRAFQEYILGQKGAYDFYKPHCSNLCEIESVIGACLIIKKELFEEIKGFNEKYFMYYEDLQLCKDIKNLGLKVGFYPDVIVEHAEGVSGLNQITQKFLHDSAKKYHGALVYYFINTFIRIGQIINWK